MLPPYRPGEYSETPVLTVSTIKAQPIPPQTPVVERVIQILANEMPQVVTALGFDQIKKYDYAGMKLEDNEFPAVLVGMSSDFKGFGIGGIIEAQESVVVFCPIHHRAVSVHMRQSELMVTAALSIMWPFRANSVTPIGGVGTGAASLWKSLEPAGNKIIPADSIYQGHYGLLRLSRPTVSATATWAVV